jgi:adenosylhomocysteine nucleosidase
MPIDAPVVNRVQKPNMAPSLPCILFALRREAMFFWKRTTRAQIIADCPCSAWLCDYSGKPVLVVQTGMGRSAAAAALRWALGNPLRIDRIIAAGFCGALRPGLSVGDLIWADEIVDVEGNCWPATCRDGVRPANAKQGRLLTTPEMISDPEQKRVLGRQYQAVAVDMESAEIARRCQEKGVSLACLRVISDDWDTPLAPRLADILKKGRVAPMRLLRAVLLQPSLLLGLWNLARHTRMAARRLAEGLASLL